MKKHLSMSPTPEFQAVRTLICTNVAMFVFTDFVLKDLCSDLQGQCIKKEEDVDLKESAIKLYKKNRCVVGRKLYCFTRHEKNYTQILQEVKYNQEIWS